LPKDLEASGSDKEAVAEPAEEPGQLASPTSLDGQSEGGVEPHKETANEEGPNKETPDKETAAPDKRPRPKNPIWEVMETVIVALVLALLIRTFVFEVFVVEGMSMETTLREHERLLVNKFAYRFRSPQPGEIVVFKYPKDPRRDFIKRTIAVAGDTIEIRDGQVFVNDKPLAEDYISRPGHSEFPRFVVPEGSIFVLGDNRNNSQDSRIFGEVPLKNVKGKAFFRFWPLSNVQWFSVPTSVDLEALSPA
jgi:signal peptidase I